MRGVVILLVAVFVLAFLFLKRRKRHVIIWYYCGDNDLESYTFRDLEKITRKSLNEDVVIHMLKDTTHMGTYRLRIDFRGIRMKRCTSLNMNRSENLENLIESAVREDPGNNYSLFISSHGAGHYLNVEKDGFFTVNQLKQCLETSNIHFDLIGFDSCLMSTLENLYELRHHTDYILASETYMPWEGMACEELIEAYNSTNDFVIIGKAIIDSYMERNKDEITSLSLLQTSKVYGLIKRMINPSCKMIDYENKFGYSDIPFDDSAVVYYRNNRFDGHGLSFCCDENSDHPKLYNPSLRQKLPWLGKLFIQNIPRLRK